MRTFTKAAELMVFLNPRFHIVVEVRANVRLSHFRTTWKVLTRSTPKIWYVHPCWYYSTSSFQCCHPLRGAMRNNVDIAWKPCFTHSSAMHVPILIKMFVRKLMKFSNMVFPFFSKLASVIKLQLQKCWKTSKKARTALFSGWRRNWVLKIRDFSHTIFLADHRIIARIRVLCPKSCYTVEAHDVKAKSIKFNVSWENFRLPIEITTTTAYFWQSCYFALRMEKFGLRRNASRCHELCAIIRRIYK